MLKKSDIKDHINDSIKYCKNVAKYTSYLSFPKPKLFHINDTLPSLHSFKFHLTIQNNETKAYKLSAWFSTDLINFISWIQGFIERSVLFLWAKPKVIICPSLPVADDDDLSTT